MTKQTVETGHHAGTEWTDVTVDVELIRYVDGRYYVKSLDTGETLGWVLKTKVAVDAYGNVVSGIHSPDAVRTAEVWAIYPVPEALGLTGVRSEVTGYAKLRRDAVSELVGWLVGERSKLLGIDYYGTETTEDDEPNEVEEEMAREAARENRLRLEDIAAGHLPGSEEDWAAIRAAGLDPFVDEPDDDEARTEAELDAAQVATETRFEVRASGLDGSYAIEDTHAATGYGTVANGLERRFAELMVDRLNDGVDYSTARAMVEAEYEGTSGALRDSRYVVRAHTPGTPTSWASCAETSEAGLGALLESFREDYPDLELTVTDRSTGSSRTLRPVAGGADAKVHDALEALGITEAEVPRVVIGNGKTRMHYAGTGVLEDRFPIEDVSQVAQGDRVVIRALGHLREAIVVKPLRSNARVIFGSPSGRVHVMDAKVGPGDELKWYSPALAAGGPIPKDLKADTPKASSSSHANRRGVTRAADLQRGDRVILNGGQRLVAAVQPAPDPSYVRLVYAGGGARLRFCVRHVDASVSVLEADLGAAVIDHRLLGAALGWTEKALEDLTGPHDEYPFAPMLRAAMAELEHAGSMAAAEDLLTALEARGVPRDVALAPGIESVLNPDLDLRPALRSTEPDDAARDDEAAMAEQEHYDGAPELTEKAAGAIAGLMEDDLTARGVIPPRFRILENLDDETYETAVDLDAALARADEVGLIVLDVRTGAVMVPKSGLVYAGLEEVPEPADPRLDRDKLLRGLRDALIGPLGLPEGYEVRYSGELLELHHEGATGSGEAVEIKVLRLAR